MKYVLFVLACLALTQTLTAGKTGSNRHTVVVADTTKPKTLIPADTTVDVNDSTDVKDSSTYDYKGSNKVYVKGYYRKNGTYVKPYTRSAPKKRH